MSCRPVLLLAVVLAGCSEPAKTPFERVAIPPFENVSGDPRLDWMSRGLAELALAGMSGSPTVHPLTPVSQREAPASRPTHILHGYFTLYRGNLRIQAFLEDARTSRIVASASAEGPFEKGILPPANAILRNLGRGARPFSTSDPAALKAYINALNAPDPAAAQENFERAVRIDPDFGAAYVSWAQSLLARGDPAAARNVVAAGRDRPRLAGAIERARLDLLWAVLAGDRPGQTRALGTLARLMPADAGVFEALASSHLLAHQYPAAVAAYRDAAERDPANPALLNMMGYAQSYAGDFAGAVESLRRYRGLRPGEANPEDSLGDVHFAFGRFTEAEKHYLEAYRKSPHFLQGAGLYKAAMARLMTGGIQGADELFRKFAEHRRGAGDPQIEIRQAQWEYASGRRKQAIARLEALTKYRHDAAPRAWAQLAVWRLEAGDLERARRDARRAEAAAADPPSRLLARVCAFLTQPPAAPAAWEERAARAFSDSAGSALRRTALAYALLFSRHFAEAARLLREIREATPPSSPEPAGILLGWALLESRQDPGDLLRPFPPPDARSDQTFACLSFPRLLALRARWLTQKGRRDEAQANYSMFLKLAGDLPTIFEDRRQLQASLAR